MGALFVDFLNISITASYIILAVILIRLIFPKIPRKFICILWAVAGIRLILPFSIESIFSLIPSTETVQPVTGNHRGVIINSGISAIDTPVNEYLGDRYYEGVTVSANLKDTVISVAAVIWAVGIAAILIYGIVSYIRVKKTVTGAVLLKDNIWQSENVVSPFILGVFKPKIYIPFNMDIETASHVIAHENAHLKRRDHWIKPLGFLILAVYWFNPLVWAAYILLCKDIERACDEKVIAQMNDDSRKKYASALLECAVNRRRIAACPLAFGETGLKERVKGVMNYRKPAFWVIILAVIACVVAAVCFLTDPKKDSEYFDSGYRLSVQTDTYYVTGNFPDDTDYISVDPKIGVKKRLPNGTKFKITEVNLQTGEVSVEFSGKPVYSNYNNLEDQKECGNIVVNDGESLMLISSPPYREITFRLEMTESIDQAITDAIIADNRGNYMLGTYYGEDHVIFATDAFQYGNTERVTAYVGAHYGEYINYGGAVHCVGGCAMPLALTFEYVDGKYNLVEYWEPEDGRENVNSIRQKFPRSVAKDALEYEVGKGLDKKAAAFYYDNKEAYSATDCAGVSLNILGFKSQGSNPYVKLEWSNQTEKSFFYGYAFGIQKFNPDLLGFEDYAPTEQMSFTTPALLVEPGETRQESYSLNKYDFSQDGYYRFITSFRFDGDERDYVAIVDFTVGDIELDLNGNHTTRAVTVPADKAKLSPNAGDYFIIPESYYSVYYDKVSLADGIEDYFEENSEKLVFIEYAEPVKEIPVIRIGTKEKFDGFMREVSGYGSTDEFELTSRQFDEAFFEENTLLMMYVHEGSVSTTHTLSPIQKGNSGDAIALSFEVHPISPEIYAWAEQGWFITVAMDNAALCEAGPIAMIATYGNSISENESVPQRTGELYMLEGGEDFWSPYVNLKEDNKFYFYISSDSNYYCEGSYSRDGDKLTLKTDDGKNTYVFKTEGDKLIFDANNSSDIPKFKPSSYYSVLFAPVTDGAVFVKQ